MKKCHNNSNFGSRYALTSRHTDGGENEAGSVVVNKGHKTDQQAQQ